MAKQLFAAEICHENAPSYIHEKLSLDNSRVRYSLQSLRTPLEEVFVLSTANTFVVYAVGDSIDPLLNFFLQDPELIRYVQFYRNTEATLNHMFAMASGLCSNIRGEYQIVAQIKQAHQLCFECGTLGLLLDSALRQAIHVGRKIRTETGIDQYAAAIVDASFELLYDQIVNLHDKSYLVIGTGTIAYLALSHLKEEGIRNVTIASHDADRAKVLATQFGVKAVSMDEVNRYFHQADVVLGGTHCRVSLCVRCSNGYCNEHSMETRNKKKVVIDFGMPRIFDEKMLTNPLIKVYNLNDLKSWYTSPFNTSAIFEMAWKKVSEEGRKFLIVLQQLEHAPLLAAYWNRLVNLKDQQLNWLLPKLENASSSDIDLIKKCAHRLIRTISRESLKDVHRIAGDTQASLTVEGVTNLCNFSTVPVNYALN